MYNGLDCGLGHVAKGPHTFHPTIPRFNGCLVI
jgi:hypothetical protein